MTVRLSPAGRRRALADLTAADALDVLVVGGGVVGAGAALDAVTRGLTVGLVEQGDWASGSSSRSSRLVNGGLGVVEAPVLGAVHAALQERSLLLDAVAPHLVRRVPVLRPLYGGPLERLRVGLDLTLYDALAATPYRPRVLPVHRHLARRAVRRIAPAVDATDLTGGVQYQEGQVDDARFALTVVRTAATYGALVADRVRVVGLLTDQRRVIGVRARETVTGDELDIRALVVVAAVGGWVEGLNALCTASGLPEAAPAPTPTSTGVHVVVPRERIRMSTGLVIGQRRAPLWVLPWGRHWLIGPSWVPARQDDGPPAAGPELVLGDVNRVLARALTPDDVEGSFAGSWRADRWSAAPGPHTPVPGLVVAAGGRFTTYRLTAARSIDAATQLLGGLQARSVTSRVPLVGSDGHAARWNQRHLLARRARLQVRQVEHLLERYGALTEEVLDLLAARPELAAPLPGSQDYLAVEALYAATHEGAADLADVLTRRTRVSTEAQDGGRAAAPYVADLVAGPLGWTAPERARQVAAYRRRIGDARSGHLLPG